ncbi:hypothetical protein G6F57_008358 [Rhizopus arrhizus]|uniref:Transcriptional regulatory protein DEP1 n=1 Tax=Rhizopus oryzae TaxID=64495 RepID=A0A9P6X5I7_RHIOR|nr:hypothetical protein G6F22_006996 [Rhizopus arrhizus]KAG1418581.1 hypothetical protein G6F58_005012 [Rhizopus delemar]KAG0796214.1 hypothetical protein G6F21_001498 [Rhizopus arrhizus]KAG0811688.1 hypothetical protein G6F20_006967 [Rhizopus arrhizus]KAG0828741.1 hypothetical protein G6F18_008936 [Rhizopus arrhizus]
MDESNTRQSSKLSLGSSPSVLSGDEEELGEPLTPTENLNEDELSALNNILRAGSSCSPSNEDDDNLSLSSISNDPQPSRVASPEKQTARKRKKGAKGEENNKKRSDSETETRSERKPTKRKKQAEDTKEREEQQEINEIKEEKEEEKVSIDEEEAEHNDDYQQKHKEALAALTHIELEFARLRDKMYQEKMLELNNEALMIANGTHPELLSLVAEIEERKMKRINSAKEWRRYQHANFKRQYEGLEYQANIHFISQKNALRRGLLNSINNKKWSIENERSYVLSLPKNISLQEDDSFSRDLLRQFDKRRSRLHFELGLLSEVLNVYSPNFESSTAEEPIREQSEGEDLSIREIRDSDSNSRQRTSSASDLLKRSSAFLRSKFESLKSNKRSSTASFTPSHRQPTKVMMKTTITLQPQQQTVSAPFIPPTITQYPPKPLVYSPVEPMHEPITQSKQLFHRISMPLLKSSNQHHHSEHPNTSRPTRRRSEPDNHNKFKKKID